nr:MAG TPA: hypothetical protein [Caudoviricetes sp.]
MARKILFAILAVCLLGPMGSIAYGKSVSGYHKRNGAYVKSYHRTSKDRTQRNNWSSKGNVNPYTGKKGTKRPKW